MKKIPAIASYLVLALICALSAVAQTPVVAQTSTADTSPTFGEIIDVRVINLEVVVTDGKTRVHGLGNGGQSADQGEDEVAGNRGYLLHV